jgi:hypothetical protein
MGKKVRKGPSKSKPVRVVSRTSAGTPAGSLAPDSLINDLPLTGIPINWEAGGNTPVSTQLESVRRSKSGQRKPVSPIKRLSSPQSNRLKTSLPSGGIWTTKAGWFEAALEVYQATDSDEVKADAARWIQIVLEWLNDAQSNLPLIQGVSALSQRQMVVLGLEIYAESLSQFWPWYSNHIEFVCELIAAITRWETCRGDSSEERIKKFLITKPCITIRGTVFFLHTGFTSDMEPLPQTATDPQICQAFKECTKQVVDPKLVSNARQRWFGKDQKYKAGLIRRINRCLNRYPIPQIPPR